MYVKIDTYRKRCYSVTNEESTGEYIDLDEHIRTVRIEINQSLDDCRMFQPCRPSFRCDSPVVTR